MAEQLDMQPISVARLIDRLEGQGLVERRADPADRRAHLLYLTAQGRALVEGLDALRTEIAGELLGEVEDEALRATLDTLATIRSRIRDGRRERQAGPAVPTAGAA